MEDHGRKHLPASKNRRLIMKILTASQMDLIACSTGALDLHLVIIWALHIQMNQEWGFEALTQNEIWCFSNYFAHCFAKTCHNAFLHENLSLNLVCSLYLLVLPHPFTYVHSHLCCNAHTISNVLLRFPPQLTMKYLHSNPNVLCAIIAYFLFIPLLHPFSLHRGSTFSITISHIHQCFVCVFVQTQ